MILLARSGNFFALINQQRSAAEDEKKGKGCDEKSACGGAGTTRRSRWWTRPRGDPQRASTSGHRPKGGARSVVEADASAPRELIGLDAKRERCSRRHLTV
jgi:hypothetical protein